MVEADRRIGAVYAPADCLGVWRRLAIVVVDVAVVWLAAVGVGLQAVVFLGVEAAAWLQFATFVLGGLVYLTEIKRSPIRTLGYRLLGARIVDLGGGTPTRWQMVQRLLFAALGPLNLLFDLEWLTHERGGQALRDQFAGTRVVRVAAAPVGEAGVQREWYEVAGGHLLMDHVTCARPAAPGAAALTGSGSSAASR